MTKQNDQEEVEDEIEDEETDADDDVSSWPTRAKVCAALKITTRELQKMVDRGEITEKRDDKNIRRYDPEELEELSNGASDNAGKLHKMVLSTINTALRESQSHTRAFFNMVHQPSQDLLGILKDENRHLRTRCSELEGRHLDVIRSYEKILSEANEREIARQEAQARQDRANQAMNLLFTMAPQLFSQMMSSSKIADFASKLDDEQIVALRAANILSPAQFAALEQLRGNVQSERQEQTEGNGQH